MSLEDEFQKDLTKCYTEPVLTIDCMGSNL